MLPFCSYTSVANTCLRACQQEQYNIIISVCVFVCVLVCHLSVTMCCAGTEESGEQVTAEDLRGLL